MDGVVKRARNDDSERNGMSAAGEAGKGETGIVSRSSDDVRNGEVAADVTAPGETIMGAKSSDCARGVGRAEEAVESKKSNGSGDMKGIHGHSNGIESFSNGSCGGAVGGDEGGDASVAIEASAVREVA